MYIKATISRKHVPWQCKLFGHNWYVVKVLRDTYGARFFKECARCNAREYKFSGEPDEFPDDLERERKDWLESANL